MPKSKSAEARKRIHRAAEAYQSIASRLYGIADQGRRIERADVDGVKASAHMAESEAQRAIGDAYRILEEDTDHA